MDIPKLALIFLSVHKLIKVECMQLLRFIFVLLTNFVGVIMLKCKVLLTIDAIVLNCTLHYNDIKTYSIQNSRPAWLSTEIMITSKLTPFGTAGLHG